MAGGELFFLTRRLFDDPGFCQLGGEEIAVFMNVMCQSNRLGVFRVSVAKGAEQIGEQMGWMDPDDEESVAEAFRRFQRAFRGVREKLGWKYDPKTRVLFIPTWWKYQNVGNAYVLRGLLTDLDRVPACELVLEFFEHLEFVDEKSRALFVEETRAYKAKLRSKLEAIRTREEVPSEERGERAPEAPYPRAYEDAPQRGGERAYQAPYEARTQGAYQRAPEERGERAYEGGGERDPQPPHPPPPFEEPPLREPLDARGSTRVRARERPAKPGRGVVSQAKQLADPDFAIEAGLKLAGLPRTEHLEQTLKAGAARALRKGRDPVGYFIEFCEGHHWDWVTGRDETAAEKAPRRYERGDPENPQHEARDGPAAASGTGDATTSTSEPQDAPCAPSERRTIPAPSARRPREGSSASPLRELMARCRSKLVAGEAPPVGVIHNLRERWQA